MYTIEKKKKFSLLYIFFIIIWFRLGRQWKAKKPIMHWRMSTSWLKQFRKYGSTEWMVVIKGSAVPKAKSSPFWRSQPLVLNWISIKTFGWEPLCTIVHCHLNHVVHKCVCVRMQKNGFVHIMNYINPTQVYGCNSPIKLSSYLLLLLLFCKSTNNA